VLQLHDARTLTELWEATRGIFQEIAPDDALSIYLNYFDFSQSWKASAVLSTPEMAKPASWHEQRRKVEVTTPFLQEHADVRLYRLSRIFPNPGEFRRSPLYRDFMRPHGWVDSVGLVYRRGRSVNSVISLRRPAHRGEYQPEEMRVLRTLHPHFESVIGRILDASEDRARLGWLERFSDHLPFVLLQLDWDLHPTYANHEAMRQCCTWNFGPRKAAPSNPRTVFRLPEPIVSACRELKQSWLLNVARHPQAEGRLTVRLAHPDEPALTATVTLQSGEADGSTLPKFTVGFATAEGSRPALDRTAALPGLDRLTVAEREVVNLLTQGCSPKTVAAQLTSIYRKVGVPGRSRLLAGLR
jgi:DNA-binding CsgD family transcriptional regulator